MMAPSILRGWAGLGEPPKTLQEGAAGPGCPSTLQGCELLWERVPSCSAAEAKGSHNFGTEKQE